MYIPLFYAEKIKNPGEAHFVKRIVLGHWIFATIAWSYLSPHPVLNAVSLMLLTLSYWCVYEIGYQENDVIGEKFETTPTLSAAYEQYKDDIDLLNSPWPWLWGICLGIVGVVLFLMSQDNVTTLDLFLSLPAVSSSSVIASPQSTLTQNTLTQSPSTGLSLGVSLLLWMLYLCSIRATFWVYNRATEATRLWIYPFLQTQKLFGFSLLASTSTVGILLLVSFVIAKWIRYCVYRCGGDRTSFPVNAGYLLIFTILYTVLLMVIPDPTTLITWQAAISFAFCLLRATKKMAALSSNLGWIADAQP